FASTLVSLVDFGVGGVVLITLMLYYRIVPTPALMFLPVVLAVHIVFTVSMSLVLAISNLFFRDVKYLFEIVLTVWMLATSVLYPISLIGGKLGAIMRLNPITQIIDGYRSVLLYGNSPLSVGFSIAAWFSVMMLAFVWLQFHRAEFTFAENV